MLNNNKERELVYVSRIEEIQPILNYDRVEHARIGAGWWVIVKKGQFKVGDLGIYFEIDSKVPEREPFMFLDKRHFKVKTLKMCGVISQGLLMSPSDFGWEYVIEEEHDGEGLVRRTYDYIRNGSDVYTDGSFLTSVLDVTYADPEDNIRKGIINDPYKIMTDLHKKLFRTPVIRWLMSKKVGRRILLFLFGKKKKKNGWPVWVTKTDEERCQNIPWLFPGDDEEWIVTEKIDGTSTTFTMRNNIWKKLVVCSRNVVFDSPNKQCFYDTNVYLEMAHKYAMKNTLRQMIADYSKYGKLEYITIQAETYGGNIQKRDYGNEHRMAIFNIIFGYKDRAFRLNPIEGEQVASRYGLPYVPVIGKMTLPATCQELLDMAAGASKIDGHMREGLVFRSENGEKSFKAVSNEFLLKYHG